MNISKRLFTYPVLSEEKKDYNSSVFDIDFNYGINDMQSIYLELNVILQNAEILQQVYFNFLMTIIDSVFLNSSICLEILR